jgi:hypothetical protein
MRRASRRRKTAGKSASPTQFRLRDKLLIALLLLGLPLLFYVTEHLYFVWKTSAALEITLARWKQQYRLSDEQVVRLRAVEREYHGSGNPLFSHTHNSEQRAAHRKQIREILGADLPGHEEDLAGSIR